MEATRRRAEFVLVVVGLALVIAAISARQSWLDRHFLPSFFIPRLWYVVIETTARLAIGGAGALLIAGRSRIARLLTRSPIMI